MAELMQQKDFEDVTTITIFGEEFHIYGSVEHPKFLAIEIAQKIEYSEDKIGQMLETVDDDEKLTDTIYRAGQGREMWFLTEEGMYELLMQSRKPKAKLFKVEIKKILHQFRCGELRPHRVNIADNNVIIDGTRFIWETNFSGDPKRDHFGSSERKANLIISDENKALELRDMGFNVKETKPRPDSGEDWVPTYYVVIKLNYDSQRPPRVFLVNERGRGNLMDVDNVGNIDDIWIDEVNAVQNIYNGPNGKSLYVKSMEIYQKFDNDPIADKYRDQEE